MQAREYRINWEIYTSDAGAAGLYYFFCRKVLFSTDPHCQFLDVSQDMRPTSSPNFELLSERTSSI